jgi:hypothetical protein
MEIKLHYKREVKENVVHKLLSKIIRNKAKEIELIEFNINDNLIIYLSNEG